MKQFRLFIISALTVAGFVSCQPESFTLGEVDLTKDDLVQGIAFSVTPDASDPNTIHLKSLLSPEYTPLWEHPQGRSQQNEVILQIPFKGEYTVTFGVLTRGGAVYGEPYVFTIDTDNLNFVNDDFWTAICGGVGNSKTWHLDLNAQGEFSDKFKGPVWYWTDTFTWDNLHTAQGLTYLDKGWDSANAIIPNTDWYWAADWAGNGWICEAADFGTMTFDLIDGAHVTTLQSEFGLDDWHGTFSLNTTNHTIDMTDAYPLHIAGHHESLIASSRSYRILYADQNFLQIMVIFDNGDTPVSLNYVWDGYVPPVVEEKAEIVLPEDWRDYVEPKTNHLPNYKLNEETPFDWFNLDGTRKEIASFTPLEDLGDVTLSFNTPDKAFTFSTLAGETFEGKYTLDDKGVYSFSTAIPAFAIAAEEDIDFALNADNSLRILSYEVDDYTGALTELWLGREIRDSRGELIQYMGYHFSAVIAGADNTPHFAAYMFFNNSAWGWNHGENDEYGNAISEKVDVTGDGDYTFSFGSEYADSDVYLVYIDITKILKKYPNADAVVKSIRIDGSEITFDDSIIDRTKGDTAGEFDLRRYIVNPWGATAEECTKFNFTTSMEVTLHVTMDTGIPFGTTPEE